MKKYIPPLILLWLLSGCSIAVWVLKKANGIRQPRLETPQSIKAWLVRRKINDSTLTLDSSDLSPFQNRDEIKNKTLVLPALPKISVYDLNGNLMEIKNTDCGYKMLDSIAKIRKDYNGNSKLYHTDSSKNMKNLKGTLNTLNGEPLNKQINLNDHSNYTYIIYWSIYMGKVSKKDINYLIKYTNTVPHSKLILVNSDLLARWKWTTAYSP